jgi:hypothetical protein
LKLDTLLQKRLKIPVLSFIGSITFLTASFSIVAARAQVHEYKPIILQIDKQMNKEIKDSLSDKDIPTGKGGFARDYLVNFQVGDQVKIALSSNSFDPFVSLIGSDGRTVGENADGPEGTYSLLVIRISHSGNYTVRVQTSSETKAVGPFTLKISRQHLQ